MLEVLLRDWQRDLEVTSRLDGFTVPVLPDVSTSPAVADEELQMRAQALVSGVLG